MRYRIRQATHIILAAIARISPQYRMYLKGRLLLGQVHNSPRMTGDMDFSAGFLPQEGADSGVERAPNEALSPVTADLGHVGSQAVVDRAGVEPRGKDRPLENASFPALKITVRHVSTHAGQRKQTKCLLIFPSMRSSLDMSTFSASATELNFVRTAPPRSSSRIAGHCCSRFIAHEGMDGDRMSTMSISCSIPANSIRSDGNNPSGPGRKVSLPWYRSRHQLP